MRKILVTFLILAVTSSLVSCDQIQLPQFPTDEPPGLIDTQAAQTISVEQTENAPTATQTIRPTRAPRTPTITNTMVFTLTNTPEPTLLPTALFTDDFSTNTGWAVKNGEDFSYGLTNGGYFISVNIPKATIWSAKSIDAADIQLETQAARLEGPDDGYYGVMCRQQRDGFNYYILVISSGGSYAVGKVVNGTLTIIEAGNDDTGVIQRGNSSNRILGGCKKNIITLTVNGTKLLEVSDDEFTSGTVGLAAGLPHGQGLYVLFDYFIAQE